MESVHPVRRISRVTKILIDSFKCNKSIDICLMEVVFAGQPEILLGCVDVGVCKRDLYAQFMV